VNILLSLTFLISQATGQASSFKIDGKEINFYFNEEIRLVSSEKCISTPKKDGCKNFDFLKKLTTKNIDRKQPGGVSIGAEVCKSILKGAIVTGTDEGNNENSFCKIKDNLFIDNGSLLYIAEKNDGIVYKGRKLIPGK
jgi:hypothetical protein